MPLSTDLISQFVKITKDRPSTKSETILYGTVYKNGQFVKIDGSDLITPYITTANVKPGDRVTLTVKNHSAIITGNLTDNSASSARMSDIEGQQQTFETIIAGRLQAAKANIDTLTADNVTVTGRLQAAEADIETLKATNGIIENLDANYAKITDLNAVKADIETLDAGVAKIDTLIFGSATGTTIQTTFSNTVIAQLGDAQIKSAMIESVSASKITAGDIITNNVRVMSEDGLLLISDETLQISDGSRVRVQIGKDASNDYSINVWDQNGNLMFSKGGITDSAIKEAIIRNDMVSDTANIAAHKLDIDSLFEEINGGTKTINSTKVKLDEANQTLDVAFKSLSDTVTSQGETITSQGTSISTIQGQITSKIWQQDINTAKNEMSTQYSTLEQKVDTITATVTSHTTEINDKADSGTVTAVSDRVSTLETGLSGFRSSVSETYATKTSLASTDTKASNAATAAANAQSDIDNLEIGARNLLLDTDLNDESVRYERYQNSGTEVGGHFYPSVQIESGVEYTVSARIRGNANVVFYQINTGGNVSNPWITRDQLSETDYRRYVLTFTVPTNRTFEHAYICTRYGEANTLIGDWFEIEPRSIKLEKGTKATDWTPAPEDVDAATQAAQTTANTALATANQNAADMATIVTNFNSDVQNLQTQIDGSITTWFYEVAPTTSNTPAVNWTTTDLKNTHLGDLYYDTVTGYCYRWQVKNNTYSWQRITDTDVTKALSDAQSAQDTADQKRRVFYTQPTAPYDKGDLWVQGSGGDILRCNIAKTSGQSYAASDWIAASKYTDDTKANTANTNAIAAQNAAAKAQSDVTALESRVSTAETNISQNTKAISLTATKTEVATAKSEAISSANSNTSNLLKNYSTTTEMNSAIELKADSITNTVSSTYATKTALNSTNSNVTALTSRVSNAETSISQLSNKITANVTETTNLGTRMTTVEQTASGLTTKLNDQTIGGTNILRGTNTMTELGSSAPWPTGGWRKAGGGTGERTIIDITDGPNADIKKGFRIVGIADDAVISQDGVPIVENMRYTISCYARGTGNLVLRVGRSPYDTGYHALSDQTIWKRYSYTFVAGLGTSGNGNALVNGKTNIYFGNNGTGTMELCGFKLELGNTATDWTPSPYDFDSGIDNASKTATNYLSFSSSGLVVGDMTSSSLGNNVLIDSDSVDIRKGTTTMASFGANYLYLAKNSRNAKIDLCNGLATLYHESKYSYDTVFIIDTGNTTELISNTSVPLCVTSGNTDFPKVSMQFAIGEEIVGGLGIVKSTATDNALVRMGANMVNTYTVLDTGNYFNQMDSGWFYTGGYGEKFSQYNNEAHSKVRYRKIGRTVEVRGAMKPVTTITGSTTQYELFTLPEGYRPDCLIYQRCQGSGTYTWMLTIRPDGMATFSRYGNGSEYVDVGTSIWLPFQITFFTD